MNRLKNVVLLFSILAILTMASSTQLCANDIYLPFATSIDTSYKPGNFEDFEPELDGDWQEFYNLLSSEKLDLNYDQLCARGEIKILDGYKVKKVSIEASKFKKISLNHELLSADWIFDKLIKSGAVKYKACDENAVFYMKKGARRQCWIEVEKRSDSIDLNLYYNNLFGIGDEFEVKLEDVSEEENLYYFVTNSIPSKSLSFKINLVGEKDSTVKISCSSRVENGKLVMALDRQISAEGMPISVLKTNQYVFDNIPVVEGQLFWTIDFKEDKPVESVKIKIDTNGEIPSVNYGEKPGILKLIGAPSDIGAIMVSSSGQTFSHPDVDSSRLKSPVLDENGNYVFTAPADLYRVSFGESEYLYDVDCKYFMNLIPVNSGEVTTITLSDEVKNAIRELRNEFVNADEKTPGSITINDVVAKNDNAEVAIVINDPLDRDVFPELQDITITENGFKGKVKDIKREMALSSIVLLLDSSGSMGENMKPAVEAAKSFVNSLNENSDISLIQFAQEITIHKGNRKKDVLKSLDTIKSIGATAMYDATAQALKLLEKKEKPFIVLFSDGADSREPGVDGKGSDLTQEQIIKKISQSNATVLTIGFGKGHDPKVLQAMSNASKNGTYVAARDKAALPAAFAKVASKFGNQFNISYERPYASIDVKSDIPVISIMMDLSGSMDTSPEEDPEDDLDYRIDKIKYVFHDFIMALPEKILMVFQSFTSTPKSSEILCRQALTSDKPAILQAIADCTARGGTPINQALKVALTNLQTVNSSKRVLVFFTDAALDSEWKNDESGATKLEYERLLETAKNEGIRILFAGLGGKAYISKYEGAFKNAAELSGGDYVISANPDDIQAKLNELLKKVEEPAKKSNMLRFNIALNCKAEDGSRMDYAAGKSLELAQLEKTGKTLKPAPIKVTTGEKYALYNKNFAENLYGADESSLSTRILNHQPFKDVTGSNKLADIKINEMFIMNSFRGLQPYESLILALNMDIKFNKKDKEMSETAYLIPNLFSHFFVSVNEKTLQPASKLTWLAEKPITKIPGNVEITVSDKELTKGMMLFEIALKPENDDPLTNLSMHFYDNNNGNIEIPIIGKMSSKITQISKLPTSVPQKITDAFSVAVKGYSDVKELCGVSFIHAEVASSFRIIETAFKSNVMALLNIDPMQRFFYAVQTDNGLLMNRMSNAVYMIPLGFTGKTMFSPGADINVRMPFVVSDKLGESESYIIGDLQDAGLKLKVTDGDAYKTVSENRKFSHEFFDLFINNVAFTDDGKRTIVVDFTIEDKLDGMGTGGVDSLLYLKSDKNDKNILLPDMDYTSKYRYGAADKTGSWITLDGQKRRGLLFFNPPFERKENWVLTSAIVKGLQIPVKNEVYQNIALLGLDEEPQINLEYENNLEKAVNAAIAFYRANRTEADKTSTITLSDKDTMPSNIAVPSFSSFGGHKIKTVKNEKDFYDLMNSISIVKQETAAILYRPEAVITQGWGSEPEVVRLALKLLGGLGYEPELRNVKLTEAGVEALKDKAFNYSAGKIMQAIEYTDEKGLNKLYVPGFAQINSALGNLYTISEPINESCNTNSFELEISVRAKLLPDAEKTSHQAITSDIFSALAGDSEENEDNKTSEERAVKKIVLFKKQISADVFSADSIDISYVSIGKSADGKGDIICAAIDSVNGILYDKNYWVDTSTCEIESVTIKIGSTYKSTKLLKSKQKLNELFQTVGFALPEFTSESANYYQKMIAKEASLAKNYNNYERAKWHGHSAIARFINMFTAYSKETAAKLDVKAFRVVPDKLIGLVVNMLSDGEKAEISIDLMNHRNMVINTEDENKNRAFNLMTGFFASQLEAEVLKDGISYINVWAALPDSAGFLCIDNNRKSRAVKVLKEQGFPKVLLERMSENAPERCFIIPSQSANVGGENRWAWLELDSETFDVVSVFDNGERAGMASYLIGMTPKSSVEFSVGAMIGISCSHFAIAAYSLESDDSKTVAVNAAALAIYAYQRVAAVQGALPDSDSILEAAKSAATDMANDAVKERTGIDAMAMYEKISGEEEEDPEPTFSDGFKCAVEAYFNVSISD